MTRPVPARSSRTTRSEDETVGLGIALAGGLRAGDLVAVDGDLGAGKTRLVRGIAAGLGDNPDEVHSPTFVLHHVHRGGRLPLHHIDLFRLGEGADVVPLDIDTLLEDGVVCVEWASYAPLLDAYDPVRVHIAVGDGDDRELTLDDRAPARVADAFRSWTAATAGPR